jgi:hypothetical protein
MVPLVVAAVVAAAVGGGGGGGRRSATAPMGTRSQWRPASMEATVVAKTTKKRGWRRAPDSSAAGVVERSREEEKGEKS